MPIVSGGSGAGGGAVLQYDFTVTGSVKASIDTNTDGSQAGAFPTSGFSMLEYAAYIRTDEAVNTSVVNLLINNDSAAHYDAEVLLSAAATVTGSSNTALSAAAIGASGASQAAGVFSIHYGVIYNYAGTVGNKSLLTWNGIPSQTGANQRVDYNVLELRSTSAVTRLSITPATGGKNLAVGTRFSVYLRQ